MPSFLIVDEDRSFRKAPVIALRLDGCQVASASSAAGRFSPAQVLEKPFRASDLLERLAA